MPWGSEGPAVGATPEPRWQSPGPWKPGAEVHSWSPSPCHPPLSPVSGPGSEGQGEGPAQPGALLVACFVAGAGLGLLQHQCGHCARGRAGAEDPRQQPAMLPSPHSSVLSEGWSSALAGAIG